VEELTLDLDPSLVANLMKPAPLILKLYFLSVFQLLLPLLGLPHLDHLPLDLEFLALENYNVEATAVPITSLHPILLNLVSVVTPTKDVLAIVLLEPTVA